MLGRGYLSFLCRIIGEQRERRLQTAAIEEIAHSRLQRIASAVKEIQHERTDGNA